MTDLDCAVIGAGVVGLAGRLNLFGIESPGLTASLAMADHSLHVLKINTTCTTTTTS